MNKKKEGIIVGLLAGVIILGMLIFAVVVELKPVLSRKANKVPVADVTELIEADAQIEVAEYYKLDMSMLNDGDNSQSMYISFLPSQKTFNYWYGFQVMGSGTYTTEGNEMILNVKDAPEPMRYILDGEHLFLESNVCAGTVPAEDVFEETFYQKTNETSVYYYEFRDDGSYTMRQTVDDDKNPKDIHADGTYTREGDMIHFIIGEFPGTPHLVYKDHLIVNFYQEISEEQFNEEIKANEEAAMAASGN